MSLPHHYPVTPNRNRSLLLWFMLGWFVVNALQACFLGLEGDESYYWVLSQKSDWSYFDHPPFVALLIQIGESIGHGPFFTRLGTVLITTLSVGVIYESLPNTLKNIRWYILVCAATLILNVYSFITTPDAPLLFFASFFLWSYKKFLSKESVANSLLMALAATGMFYSKYHGVLLIGFVVLSNPKLLLNKYFWLMAALTSLLFLPHLYWQYTHDWPSIRYHLNERLAKNYKINFTTDYLLGQLLIFGPFISLLFYATCYKLKIKDKLLRTHLFIFIGTQVFFFLSSFKNTVEPHWTLIAAPSYIALFIWLLTNGTHRYQILFTKISIANIVIIFLARILFLIPGSPFEKIRNYQPIFYGKKWAQELKKHAGDTPVIFENSYVLPSLYRYYNPEANAFGYNTKSYRKTNFNLVNDCDLSGQKVLYYTNPADMKQVAKQMPVNMDHAFIPIEQYTCVNALKMKPVNNLHKVLERNRDYTLIIMIENESSSPVRIYGPLAIDYAFFIAKNDYINSNESYTIKKNLFRGNEKKSFLIHLKTPEKAGSYKLLFSLKNGPFAGNFASAFYPVTVN